MLSIIKPRRTETMIARSREFAFRDDPSRGFGFECDARGVVNLDTLTDAGRANLAHCQSGALDVDDLGVVERSWSYTHPAEGRCMCGRVVILDGDNGDGIDCACGRIYNAVGQELAPRAQWVER